MTEYASLLLTEDLPWPSGPVFTAVAAVVALVALQALCGYTLRRSRGGKAPPPTLGEFPHQWAVAESATALPAWASLSLCAACNKALAEHRFAHCEICEVKVHMACRNQLPSHIQCKQLYAVGVDALKNNRDGKAAASWKWNVPTPLASERQMAIRQHRHAWTPATLSLNELCIHCESFTTLASCFSTGFRCLWCRAAIHHECRADVSPICSMGEHRRFIVPPEYVWPVSASGRDFSGTTGRKSRASSATSMMAAAVRGGPQVDKSAVVDYEVDQLPADIRPLLVFVNSRSGPQEGHLLLVGFKQLLNPVQVVDLDQGGPRPALERFRHLPRLRILVCGGDGTLAWVLGEADAMGMLDVPIVPLPLGTGNDLAIALKWGGGYSSGQQSLSSILFDVANATETVLDRWDAALTPRAPPSSTGSGGAGGRKGKRGGGSRRPGRGSGSATPTSAAPSAAPVAPAPHKMVFNNYLGVGVDGALCVAFHNLRRRNPHWFSVSRILNKAFYANVGAAEILLRSCADLRDNITLTVDGKVIELPDKIEGVLCIHIPSFGGGVDLWGQAGAADSSNEPWSQRSLESASDSDSTDVAADGFLPQRYNDGLIEVVGVDGSFHLASTWSGLRSPFRLAQGRVVSIDVRKKFPVQIDGEPYEQDVQRIHIERRNAAFMLSKRVGADDKVKAVFSDVLDWGVEGNVINRDQRNMLMRELAMRS